MRSASSVSPSSIRTPTRSRVRWSTARSRPSTTIADGSYPVSRPLYFYVKKAHVGAVPGIEEYLAEFTSDKAMGDEGYLADKGLIPMPEAEREQFRGRCQGA